MKKKHFDDWLMIVGVTAFVVLILFFASLQKAHADCSKSSNRALCEKISEAIVEAAEQDTTKGKEIRKEIKAVKACKHFRLGSPLWEKCIKRNKR